MKWLADGLSAEACREDSERQAATWKDLASTFNRSDSTGAGGNASEWLDAEEWREEGRGEAEMWEQAAAVLGLNTKTATRKDRILIELAFYAEIGERPDLAALVARHSYPHKRATAAATAARRKYGEMTRRAVEAGEAEIRRKGGVGRISSPRLARKVMSVGAHGKRHTVSDRHVRRIRAGNRKPDTSNGDSS